MSEPTDITQEQLVPEYELLNNIIGEGNYLSGESLKYSVSIDKKGNSKEYHFVVTARDFREGLIFEFTVRKNSHEVAVRPIGTAKDRWKGQKFPQPPNLTEILSSFQKKKR